MNTSIIIPTAGRPIAIKAAVESLLKLAGAGDQVEMIVVDNNTREDLSYDLEAFCGSLAGAVRYVREPSPGLGAARHRGAAEAKGELLTFIDDDVEVSETWLTAIQRGFSNPEVAMVGGPSIPKFTCSIPSWFWSFMATTPYGGWMNPWLSLLDIGRDVANIDPDYIWGLNFSIRKQVLYDVGGFHPDLVPSALQRWQGDGETGLTAKVAAAGYRADYRHDAMLTHLCGPDRLNVEYFRKRAYYQGVCDSFTQIRAGAAPSVASASKVQASWYRWVRGLAGEVFGRVLPCGNLWAADGAPVKELTDRAYLGGWLFHQRAVAAEPRLLAWVQRSDYFDTDIRSEEEKCGL